MSEGLDPRMLLRGYAAGIFPMADSRGAGDIFWVEPRSRAIIPLSEFHLSRSLPRNFLLLEEQYFKSSATLLTRSLRCFARSYKLKPLETRLRI